MTGVLNTSISHHLAQGKENIVECTRFLKTQECIRCESETCQKQWNQHAQCTEALVCPLMKGIGHRRDGGGGGLRSESGNTHAIASLGVKTHSGVHKRQP